MHDRKKCLSAAIAPNRTRYGRTVSFCARALVIATVFCLTAGRAAAQNPLPPSIDMPVSDPGAAPVSQSGNIDFFSQDLGTILRLRYNTESYGQDGVGNFDVGTMQVVTMDGAAAFFDGQVTMNDTDGIGFNLGLGYRWMSFPPYSVGTGRMEGVSVWVDGTHTDAGNFFPQVGVSLESLGEKWDVRANGYVPVGDQEQVGPFRATGATGFTGFSIASLTQAIVDRSFYAAELEIARRYGPERDAWGFFGPYFVGNSEEDSAGVRVGVRGYAYPDLLLQVAVSHDDIFDTNAAFSATWFVGRTRTNFQPACGTADRFREPVMRNDYVVLSHTKRRGGLAPLTNPDGSALRIVHVDSSAGNGGDGTFENPFNQLSDANGAGSQAGDIIFAHSTSVFTDDPSLILKNNQKVLGEGNNFVNTVATAEKGTIDIPESSPGARALARPQINIPANTDAIVLADNNEVANFDMDGQNNAGNRAIAAPAGGAGSPNLHDLDIVNTGGDGIFFKPADFIDVDDLNGNNNTTERLVRGNVAINNVTFDNIGGNAINIDSATAADVTLPTTTLQEGIVISNVTVNNGAGRGIVISNTHTTGTTSITGYTYDGGTTSLGGIQLNNFDATFNAANSTLTNGAAAGQGVQILGDTDGDITFASTVALTSLDGTAFDINGDVAGVDSLGGSVTVEGNITNDTGLSVSVQNITTGANIVFNGNITDTGQGVRANSNSGGLILFAGDLTMTTTTNDAIALTNNTDTSIDFPGKLDITTTSGNGFVATGGGTLTASGTTNTITTDTGQIAQITGMTIGNLDVKFSEVNRTTGAATSAIQLENNTGTGSIDFGTPTNTAGQTGTIAGGAADTIVINNSANVSITGLIVNNAAGFSGVHVGKNTADTQTTDLSDLQINNGDAGIEVAGGGAGVGALNMTINDTAINGSTAFGLNFDNVDVGTVQVNDVTLDGNNAAAGATGVRIANSDATFIFDNAPATDNTVIREWGNRDFEVDGGAPTITFRGAIINASADNAGDTTGRSVLVHNVTGGSVNFTAESSIKDDNEGMLVENNSGGAFSFLGTHDFDTTTADAVTVQNNTGTTDVIFDGLDITTTSGRGVVIAGNASTTSVAITDVDVTSTSGAAFTATGAGDLTVAGANNVISTTTGTGLTISGMNIVGQASFESVSVNGAANGIVLTSLTGAQVTVGEAGGAQNSGGTLTTTGDALVITNTENVDLLHLQIVNAGGNGVTLIHQNTATTQMDVTIDDLNLDASTGTGISVATSDDNNFNLRLRNSDLEEDVVITSTASGHFGLLVDNNDITTGATDAFSLAFTGSAPSDITFQNGNIFTAGNANALFIDAAGGVANTMRMNIQDSSFTNTSAASPTADILSRGATQMDLTVQGNTFLNNADTDPLHITTNGAAAHILLNLGSTAVAADKNTANGGVGTFELIETAGDFDIFEKNATVVTDTKNNGAVNTTPNDAAFDDSAVAPPLPTIP